MSRMLGRGREAYCPCCGDSSDKGTLRRREERQWQGELQTESSETCYRVNAALEAAIASTAARAERLGGR